MTNQDDNTNNLLFQALLAAIALCLFYMLTACSPYAAMYPQPTQGATSTAAPAVLPSPSSTTQPTKAPAICRVTTGIDGGSLNLRTGPGTHAGIIRVLAEGEKLTIVSRGAWLEVIDSQGNHGFINSRYCDIGE